VPAYCDRCGFPVDGRDHELCQRARRLEPPRYCATCGRRLVVQVTPSSWTAHCSEHGDVPDGGRPVPIAEGARSEQ